LFHADGQTNSDEANRRFHNFANTPKKEHGTE